MHVQTVAAKNLAMASPLETWYSSQPTAASRFDDASELSWFHSEQPHFPHSPEFKTDAGTVNMLGSEWEKGLLKFEDPMDAKDDSFFTATAVQKHEVSFPDPLTTKTLDDDYSLLPATSNDLTEILFGQTNEISDYSLTLKDDRFRIANMESEVTLYPVFLMSSFSDCRTWAALRPSYLLFHPKTPTPISGGEIWVFWTDWRIPVMRRTFLRIGR